METLLKADKTAQDNKSPAYGNIIGDREIIEGEELPVYNKFTGEQIGIIYKAGREVVAEAVACAVETFKTITLTPAERSKILLRAAALLGERKADLAITLVKEVGRTLKDCEVEVTRAINTFTISAEEAKRINGHCIPMAGQSGHENRLAFTMRIPVGVIGAITPFNNPLNLTAHKIAPAIAAGNTVVLKPSELTPIAVMKLVEILKEAGLPAGYINVVHGLGHETGQYLIEDERINMFSFTGSVPTGRHIKRVTGIKKVTLELGNNSPTIIHKDAAKIDMIVELCAARGYTTANGQGCICVQRLYVHKEIYDIFLFKLLKYTQSLKAGDPEDPATDVGPLIAEKEAIRLEVWVNEAVAGGAKLLCGGHREGPLFHPTLLTDVKPGMKVMCREVFGPVISVVPYTDIDAVFKEANDSEFGLQAGIFTTDINLAMRAAKELEFGGVIINDVSTYRTDAMPYGGIKNSGLGKEGPKYAIEEMTDERVIVINL